MLTAAAMTIAVFTTLLLSSLQCTLAPPCQHLGHLGVQVFLVLSQVSTSPLELLHCFCFEPMLVHTQPSVFSQLVLYNLLTEDLREVSNSLGVGVLKGVFTYLCPFFWHVVVVLALRRCILMRYLCDLVITPSKYCILKYWRVLNLVTQSLCHQNTA